MTVRLLDGIIYADGGKDDDGHRTYNVSHRVEADWVPGIAVGPAEVMNTPGLPLPGSFWLMDNDIDIWAFCYPFMDCKPHAHKEGHPVQFWTVNQKFSTKPLKRCQDTTIENPLLEPFKISGSFVKYSKEAAKHFNGEMIKSSSHEPLKGPAVEFDRNRPTVRIEQNVASLELDIFSQMIDCLNDAPLWGLGPRCIKLSQPSWTRQLYGTCTFYYTRVFEFDIDYDTFDREAPDEGTKVLRGHWRFKPKASVGTGTGTANQNAWVLDLIDGNVPDHTNPSHFCRYKDRNGENARTLLNGYGLPAETTVMLGTGTFIGTGSGSGFGTGTGTSAIHSPEAAQIKIQGYKEANFLLLGVPTSF